MLDLVGVFLALTAVFAYLNHRYLGLPSTIGVTAIALTLSTLLLVLDMIGIGLPRDFELSLLASVDFTEVLMGGMLSVLLFAGALHVDLSELKAFRWQVGTLAIAGTVVSTLLVGYGMSVILPMVGLHLPLAYCLAFGTLIAPTDPIAVMGILKSAGAPRALEVVIAGESLFNDGVGVVLFALVVGLITSGSPPTLAHAASLLLREAGGGLLYGIVLGGVIYFMLKSIDSYQEEVLITLAGVLGGYALAHRLGVSGPLAMVAAGLILGNHGRAMAMSDQTRRNVDMFWELLDSILNAVLFVLLGLEIIVFSITLKLVLPIIVVIAITLLARLLAVGLPVALLGRFIHLPQGAWQVLTWGGLRGGISVALALSLPAGDERILVVTLTYAVVVFSILVQGMSIGWVTQHVVPCSRSENG